LVGQLGKSISGLNLSWRVENKGTWFLYFLEKGQGNWVYGKIVVIVFLILVMRLDPYLGDVTGLSSLMVDESRKIAGLLLEDLSENSGQMLLNNKILFRKVLSDCSTPSKMYSVSSERSS
jgi:hypothetical protein